MVELICTTSNKIKNKTFHTIRTAPKTNHTIPYHENSSKQQNIPYHENSSKNKTYHTMRTAQKKKYTIP
jgi:hypothetical protein